MIATLAKLHHCVDEVGHVVLVRSLGKEGKVFLQNGTVVLLLNVSELHLDDCLLFRGQILLHIILQSPQHHGLQNGLQFLYLWECYCFSG